MDDKAQLAAGLPALSPVRTSAFPRSTPAATALIATLVTIAYGPTMNAPFIFDDLPGIVRNASIRQLWPIGEVLFPTQESGTGVVGRPVVNLSLALNYAAGGLDVFGYHLFNLLTHIGTAVLLYAGLCRTLLRMPAAERASVPAAESALIVALLWALHPLQTESVTCVIQRTELLVGFFYILTLYAFSRSAGSSRPRGWRAVAITAGVLGMASKEVMVTAPLLVLLYDRTFIAGTFRRAWQERRNFYLTLAATWIPLAGLVLLSSGRGGTAGFGTGVSPWEYLLTQCRAIVGYLQLAAWPHPLVLDYGEELVRSLRAVGSQAILLLTLGGATGFALRYRPVLGFVGAWFFVVLAPSSSVVPLASQTISEHRMYLPLAALVAMAVGALRQHAGRRVFRTIGAVIVTALMVLTLERNRDYSSAVRIWQDTVAKMPENPRARYNLGNALAAAGRGAEALVHYDHARRLSPRDPAVLYNLASTLVELGRDAEAVPHFESALRIDSNAADVRVALAGAWARLGRPHEAVAHYEAAERRVVLNEKEELQFGRALAKVGRRDDAETRLRNALQLNPARVETHLLLGLVLSESNRRDEALLHLREAVRLAPTEPSAHATLGDVLAEAGRMREAATHYEAALQLDPADAETRANLERVRAATGSPLRR